MRNEATNKVINHNFFTQIKPSGWSSALTLLISLLFSFLSMCFCLLFDTLCQKEYVLRIMRQITVCLHRTHCASVELRIEPSLWRCHMLTLFALMAQCPTSCWHYCGEDYRKLAIVAVSLTIKLKLAKKTLRKRQILQISCSQSKT